MNSKAIISAVIAMSMLSSSAVFAQRNDRGNERNDRAEQNQRGDEHRNDEHRNDERRGDEHRDDQIQGRNDRNDYTPVAHDDRGGPRGAGPRHDMRRGGRLSNEYRGNQYVVSDWRGHHLNAPPRGYHWVQTGGDYVLAAVATGIIMQVLLNN